MTTHPRFSHTTRAHSFNTAAAQYAANRPSYPPALFTTLEDLAAHPSRARRSSTWARAPASPPPSCTPEARTSSPWNPGRAWPPSSAAPTPTSPWSGVPATPSPRHRLRRLPHLRPVLALDEPGPLLPEAFRVLRPGGALALWWNTAALDVPWIAAQARRIDQYFEDAHPTEEDTATKAEEGTATKTEEGTATKTKKDTESHQRTPGFLAERAFKGAPEPPPHTHRVVRWSRQVPVDTHLANIGSHSAFLVIGEEDTDAFLAEERTRLLETFPDGRVEEVYDVLVIVATRS